MGERARKVRTDLTLPHNSALEGGQMPLRPRGYGPVGELVYHLLFVSSLLDEADWIVGRPAHLMHDLWQGKIQVQRLLTSCHCC